jgi:pimeloyl-ACP methyl ester carboxylesterase
MRRILLAALVVLGVLLAVNTVVTDRETKPAKADIGSVVDLPGGDLQVREDGSPKGPPVVLLHGFASSIHWWTPVAKRLASRFHVIRIDLLGHGGSAKPKSGYSMENQAHLVALALARLGIRDAIVAGHSMGGVVATALAERYPALVKRIVIVDSPPNKDAGELPFLARLGFVPVLGETIRRVVPDSAVRDNLGKAFADGFDVPDQFVRDFRRMTYRSYDDSHKESSDYNESKAMTDRLAGVRKPLLVIFGTEDDLIDPDSFADYKTVPGAQVVPIPGTGHSPMVEKPDEVSQRISDFAGARPRRSGRTGRPE